jgi:cellulose biosynthesis protein BcsQ
VSWAEKAARRHIPLDHLIVEDCRDSVAIYGDLGGLKSRHQLVVIDLPGEETADAAAAVAHADVVVTPMKVSEQDFAGARAAQRFVTTIGRETGRAIPQLFVINEVTLNKQRSVLFRAFDQLASAFDMRFAETIIREKDRLNRLTGTEGTLYAMQEDSDAWRSAAAIGASLANEILSLIQFQGEAA